MKQNFTVRQGALDGVEVFLSVAQHRSFRRAAAELGVRRSTLHPHKAQCRPDRSRRTIPFRSDRHGPVPTFRMLAARKLRG